MLVHHGVDRNTAGILAMLQPHVAAGISGSGSDGHDAVTWLVLIDVD